MSGACTRCGAFTVPTEELISNSLVAELVCAVDEARDIATQLGVRTYDAHVIRLRWSGGEIGSGTVIQVDDLQILPTPRVEGMDTVSDVVESYGALERGEISIDRISLSYTEDDLTGLRSGPLSPGEEVIWEITSLAPNAKKRHTFHLGGAPTRKPGTVEWSVGLVRATVDRGAPGELWT